MEYKFLKDFLLGVAAPHTGSKTHIQALHEAIQALKRASKQSTNWYRDVIASNGIVI